jgi:hypothetical protein
MAQQKTLYPKISFRATTVGSSDGGRLWIHINVAAGYSFHVNWGDGKQERFIGEGKYVALNHNYFPRKGSIPEGGISFHAEIFSNEKNCRITELGGPNGKMDVSELDIRHCVELEVLSLADGLTTLYLSKNTALQRLYCSSAKLSELDVSNNTELVVLNCSHNGLQKLDLSNNKALQYLNCRWNAIKTLDLSNNPALRVLHCTDNGMRKLVVGHDSKLQKASFMEGNHIDANTEKSIMGIIEYNSPEECDEQDKWFDKFDRCLQLPW